MKSPARFGKRWSIYELRLRKKAGPNEQVAGLPIRRGGTCHAAAQPSPIPCHDLALQGRNCHGIQMELSV